MRLVRSGSVDSEQSGVGSAPNPAAAVLVEQSDALGARRAAGTEHRHPPGASQPALRTEPDHAHGSCQPENVVQVDDKLIDGAMRQASGGSFIDEAVAVEAR